MTRPSQRLRSALGISQAVGGVCVHGRIRRWHLCFDTFNATQKMTLTDGTELSPALGIGAFADKTLVHEGQCTKGDPAADPAVAGLLGCGVMAGLGAAVNTGAINRDDTVAVIGCGGVGDAAIAGAALVGRRILAVDAINAKDLDAVETIIEGGPEFAGHLQLAVVDVPLVEFFSRGESLKSSWCGDCLPERDSPP